METFTDAKRNPQREETAQPSCWPVSADSRERMLVTPGKGSERYSLAVVPQVPYETMVKSLSFSGLPPCHEDNIKLCFYNIHSDFNVTSSPETPSD